MRLYTIEIDNVQKVAVEGINGRLYPLNELGFDFKDMNDLIERISQSDKEKIAELITFSDKIKDKVSYDLEEAKICAPIPKPHQDLICLGVNYESHILESGNVDDFLNKEATVYFSKRVNYAIGTNDEIPNYDFVDSLDYEAELGVVIGKDVKNYKQDDGTDCIFGYTVINDVSARNLQFRHKQWYVGKSLDGYTIIGPCIVTADEIKNVQKLSIACRVNGEVRQSSNTELMIQTVCGAIEELSQGITLKAGTIISTGTPGGVGFAMNPPACLKSGDIVECEIESIGKIVNKVAK